MTDLYRPDGTLIGPAPSWFEPQLAAAQAARPDARHIALYARGSMEAFALPGRFGEPVANLEVKRMVLEVGCYLGTNVLRYRFAGPTDLAVYEEVKAATERWR